MALSHYTAQLHALAQQLDTSTGALVAVVAGALVAGPLVIMLSTRRKHVVIDGDGNESTAEVPPFASNWLGGEAVVDVASMGVPKWTLATFKRLKTKIYQAKMLGTRTTVIYGPELYAQFVRKEHKHLKAKWIGQLLDLFTPDSILAVNGVQHDAQRSVLLKHFDHAQLRMQAPRLAKLMSTLLDDLANANGAPKDVFEFANLAGFVIIATVIYCNQTQEFYKRMMRYTDVFRKGFNALPIRSSYFAYGQALNAADSIRRMINDEIERRNANPTEQRPFRDFLDASLAVNDPETNQPYERQKFLNAFATTQFGALDTTVGALWLACVQFARRPDVLDKVREEIDAFVRKRGAVDTSKAALLEELGVTYDELIALPYLEATYMECLRVSSPGAMGARYVDEDFTLKSEGREYILRKGENLWVAHTATVFTCADVDAPDTFKPERFLAPVPQAAAPYALPVFGAGQRMCPGMKLAAVDIKLYIALLAMKRIRFAVDPAHPDCPWTHSPTPVPESGHCWLLCSQA